MMTMNGQLLLNLILNYSRNRRSYKKLGKSSLRRKWKDNLTSNCNKRKEENKWNKRKNNNTRVFKINKLKHMIKEKKKRNKNIKGKLCKKRKWEINKLKTRTNVKSNKKREKTNLTTYLLKKLNKKLTKKNKKWEIGKKKILEDSNRPWLKTKKIKKDWKNKPKDKDYKYFYY